MRLTHRRASLGPRRRCFPSMIDRMARVCRHAIGSDAIIEAAILLEALAAIVTWRAEALDFAEPKKRPIATVWDHVIDDRCDSDLAVLRAIFAKRSFA